MILVGSLVLAATLGSACSSKAKAATTCKPSGTSLSLSAQNRAFNKPCLAAPANQAFTIAFASHDGAALPHNVAIFTDSSASKSLFVGASISTGSTVYHVPALPAGTYYFRCNHHPSMNGTFIVR